MNDMKPEYRKELIRLTPRQHHIVMGGLKKKLAHHDKTGILSYSYEVCPVCKDVGSTLEHQRCEECYIQKSCQAPFTDGFRNDTPRGVAYFGEMFNVLNTHIPPEVAIVGGTWDEDGGRPSGLVAKLADEFRANQVYNGGNINDLTTDLRSFPLVIWMPNISNGEAKAYPQKGTGNVLVCSKVMRPAYTKADSVSRIFAMQANAVIEVRRAAGSGKFVLGLRDAMANWWAEPATSIASLVQGIIELYWWTKGSLRIWSSRIDKRDGDVQQLMELTSKVADRVENSIGERYFGNVSTRCQSMFPGVRSVGRIFISPRNVDKRRIEVEDMVLVEGSLDPEPLYTGPVAVRYWGPRKPSVDAPVQVYLFRAHPEINFMIHGHAKVKGARTTDDYFPCGDMREAYAVEGLIAAGLAHHHCGAINLRNHGFLLYSKTIEGMAELVENLEIEEPN
jgi:hypothetical protein